MTDSLKQSYRYPHRYLCCKDVPTPKSTDTKGSLLTIGITNFDFCNPPVSDGDLQKQKRQTNDDSGNLYRKWNSTPIKKFPFYKTTQSKKKEKKNSLNLKSHQNGENETRICKKVPIYQKQKFPQKWSKDTNQNAKNKFIQYQVLPIQKDITP